MSAPILQFERKSLQALTEELKEVGPKAVGVIAITYDADGRARFRISGFAGGSGTFLICGLLDWIKADLLADLLRPQ